VSEWTNLEEFLDGSGLGNLLELWTWNWTCTFNGEQTLLKTEHWTSNVAQCRICMPHEPAESKPNGQEIGAASRKSRFMDALQHPSFSSPHFLMSGQRTHLALFICV